MFPEYETAERWADVTPIPQNEGGPFPLAAIAYTDEYSTAMSYLRAVMATNETSDRTLELTEHIINMNPAHYTVWLYRATIVKALERDPSKELAWLTNISLQHLKNYQIWHHRQVIMIQLTTLPSTERPFLARMLSRDGKNYHVWSYRQWLVRHFALWPADESPVTSTAAQAKDPELAYTEDMLHADVRNNSAWHHRHFVIFGGPHPRAADSPVFAREIEFAKARILLAPQNASPWLYLRGVLTAQARAKAHATGKAVGKNGHALAAAEEQGLDDFASSFANIDQPDQVRSSHALDFLADVWAAHGQAEKADRALQLLSERFDPIRKNYWQYRRGLLDLETKA